MRETSNQKLQEMAKVAGERLVKLRGETPRDLVAEKCLISVSALQMYENGKRIPRDPTKVRLARYYGKTVQEIFFDPEVHER